MNNPRFENVSEMENNAVGQDDREANLRLRYGGGKSTWLRVVYNELAFGPAFTYVHDVGRKNTNITRAKAQGLIDREWGRL